VGYTKDLWTRPSRSPDGTVRTDPNGKVIREPNSRWGKGKRWLACWSDPDGNEPTKAFANYKAAERHWKAQETDAERGEYVDQKAGKERFDPVAERWLRSRSVDPTTRTRYRRCYRLHVKPTFGDRGVSGIKASEIQTLLTELAERRSLSVVKLARHIIQGTLELALADGALKANPAKSRTISVGKPHVEKVTAWSDEVIWKVIDAHAKPLRCMPLVGATCGHREGELYAVAEDDVQEGIIHIRRQIKLVDKTWVFAMPKNDTERIVPLSNLTAESIRVHKATYSPIDVTLPWEKSNGELRTYRLLFSHPGRNEHLRSSTYNSIWKKALVTAGVLPEPVKTKKGYVYATTGREGRHALRHYYANLQLSGGTNIRELAEYLGHHDPGFTLRVYGHMQPDSHERARQAVDKRLFRPRAV
jgi:integrase